MFVRGFLLLYAKYYFGALSVARHSRLQGPNDLAQLEFLVVTRCAVLVRLYATTLLRDLKVIHLSCLGWYEATIPDTDTAEYHKFRTRSYDTYVSPVS